MVDLWSCPIPIGDHGSHTTVRRAVTVSVRDLQSEGFADWQSWMDLEVGRSGRMLRDLHGRNILITGASRGIGRCVAEKLALLDVKLTLAARTLTALNELADKLRVAGATVFPIAADVTDATQRERLVREAVEKMGGLDVLINNAGIASFGHFDTSSETVLRNIMEVNFFAPAEMMRLALPHLAKGREPAILNVASVCGRRGLPGWPEHCTSKFAIVGLSEALRGEFARFDVDVLVVLPGLVKSDGLGRHLLRNEGRMQNLFANAQPPEAVAEAVIDSLRRNCKERPVGSQSKWLLRVNKFFPRFVDRMMARKVRQLYSSNVS
jgi:short-subunit dehydrogenase